MVERLRQRQVAVVGALQLVAALMMLYASYYALTIPINWWYRHRKAEQ